MIYATAISKKKTILYNSAGRFACPVLIAQEKESNRTGREPYVPVTERHENAWTGKNHLAYIKGVTVTLPNGDQETTKKIIRQEVTASRKDILCRCGEPMVFLGYPVWTETVKNEGKKMFEVFGSPIYNNRIIERSAYRYFKKKSSQIKYVREHTK